MLQDKLKIEYIARIQNIIDNKLIIIYVFVNMGITTSVVKA